MSYLLGSRKAIDTIFTFLKNHNSSAQKVVEKRTLTNIITYDMTQHMRNMLIANGPSPSTYNT